MQNKKDLDPVNILLTDKQYDLALKLEKLFSLSIPRGFYANYSKACRFINNFAFDKDLEKAEINSGIGFIKRIITLYNNEYYPDQIADKLSTDRKDILLVLDVLKNYSDGKCPLRSFEEDSEGIDREEYAWQREEERACSDDYAYGY